MSPVILTISPSASVGERFWRQLKNFIRNRFFFYGGPQSVLDSLTRGFNLLGIDYKLNPKEGDIPQGSVIGVLSGLKALKWAIEAKKAGKIKKIIAGPNIVILPADGGEIMKDAAVDVIVLPSRWPKDFWISLAPELENKIRVWPAGVETPALAGRARSGCLVYKKRTDEKMFSEITKDLEAANINYKILSYGRYKREDYFRSLEESEFMIFLSESESQGLALCEAWMRDVPVLAWSRGYWRWKNYEWRDEKVGAPYLTDEAGMFFKDAADFKEKLPVFLEKIKSGEFRPRQYAIENFSDKTAAKEYLEI